ncbi:hypothetical protein QVD17_38102 [Tagetes erecta]|uniref:Uncharacterized protein n=1 Tax=Tagetes erecta TaxID=13708 RepID=A0AAD8JZK2_TARER|nr:hypothetical protein QVD17_38102 [Tagetes erecta]
MTAQLIGAVNQNDHPSYIQTNPINFETGNTIPQRARRQSTRSRGRRGSQVNNSHEDHNEHHGFTLNFQMGTINYMEGTSHFQGGPSNYGEGTSNHQVDTQTSEVPYRPEFQNSEEDTSNIQVGTPLNVNDYPIVTMDFGSLFNHTPTYTQQFQNYQLDLGLQLGQPDQPNEDDHPVPSNTGSPWY